jgi:hypothetical protein
MPRKTRPAIREAEVRAEPAREPVRAKTRTRKGANVNQFHIPQHMIPDGIDLQWNTDSVLGKPEPHMRQTMAVQGWEPVTADMWGGRFDGMFMPKGHKGEINVGGQVLEWRPIELTLEARAEEHQAARHARNVEERKIAIRHAGWRRSRLHEHRQRQGQGEHVPAPRDGACPVDGDSGLVRWRAPPSRMGAGCHRRRIYRRREGRCDQQRIWSQRRSYPRSLPAAEAWRPVLGAVRGKRLTGAQTSVTAPKGRIAPPHTRRVVLPSPRGSRF